MGRLAKTDAIDAAVLAEVRPARSGPRCGRCPTRRPAELDALLDRRRQLIGMRTMERNRLSAGPTGQVRRDLEAA